ncbi:MAG: MFS transporter [Propionibacteriaceae bacterium]|jgi:AAHS family benzoate transporter-like MFS transporter|nr:MFS transporter [Propionibacteriaceae bacterium]
MTKAGVPAELRHPAAELRAGAAAPRSPQRLPWAVIAICGTAIAFDGYDLVVYGATLLSLRAEWGMSAAQAGMLGSLPLLGMLLGSMLAGAAADRWGRRRVFVGAVAWFSVFTVACALAAGPTAFAGLRLLAGLGLGGVLPVAAALTMESAPPGRANLAYVIMQSGYPAGGIAASLLALVQLPAYGWRVMYAVAAAPLLVIVPLAFRCLPSGGAGRGESEAGGAASVRKLLSGGLRRHTLVFWGMSLASLLFVYGMNTWLPSLMVAAGHTLSSGLGFLAAFNAGAILGGLCGGWAADRWGSRRVVAVSFLCGAAAVGVLAGVADEGVMLSAVALAGYGAVGTQTLINGWVTRFYPDRVRATGIGWSLGIGRFGGIAGPFAVGVIEQASGTAAAAFALFAAVALGGAALSFLARPARGDRHRVGNK